MTRWILLMMTGVLLGAAAPLTAETVAQYQDDVYLRDHETVRYRVDIDYGTGTQVDLTVLARGFSAPPRVRILNEHHHEIRDVRDTDGDWTVEPSITATDSHDHYYVEVDSAKPWKSSRFEVTISVDADPSINADADIQFDKYFRDYNNSDHNHHCSAMPGSDAWPLALLALLAAGALGLRRRAA